MKKENEAGLSYAPIKGMELIKRVKSEPKRKFIWAGIREGSMGLFVGAGKTGKTTIAENLAISLAVGKKQFFNNQLDGKPQKVAFINLEEDYSITGERLGNETKNLTESEIALFEENFYATPYDFPSFMNNEDDWKNLNEYVGATKADVIFIDSLSHLFVGEIEVSSQAQKMMQLFKEHVSVLGKTVIVIHHTTKGNDQPITQDKIAGSRIITQEFNWAYGFAKIPSATGGQYMCPLFNKFKYADESMADLYQFDEDNWIKYLDSTNKYKLYQDYQSKTDGRRGSKNQDLLLDYFVNRTSQGSQTISTSQLMSEFVETNTMSKDTLYQNINKLNENDKIEKIGRGEYKFNEDGEKKQMLNGLVYKAENKVTGESYIGITTYSIKQRQLDHIERALRGENGKFYEAIATYGEEAFKWEQIDTANDANELAAKEKSYVLSYNSMEEGYNSDSGGGIRKTVYQYDVVTKELVGEYKNLISAGDAIGATKQDISRACLSANGMFGGWFWSYNKTKFFIPNGDARKKGLIQLDLDNNIITEFDSVSEASRKTGISKTCISRVCRGERDATGGYKWKYIN